MSRLAGSCCLFALALCASLAVSPRALAAQAATPPDQTPTPVPTQAASQPAPPAENAAPAPAAASPTQLVAVPAGPPPTPEQLGDSLSARQRYQAAIAAYSKVEKPNAEIWNKMGIAYQMMFALKDATRCYNAAVKLDPRNPTYLNNLATVFDSLKQYGNSERLYRKALKLDPHSALIHRNLGSNLLTQHKYKKGWDAYKTALAIDPQIFQSRSGVSVENPASVQERGAMHYYMARGCVSAGNSECAIHNLRLALNEGYTNPKKIADDNGFASLRDLPAYQMLIAAQGAPQ
jgi:tetratricopeptide (TPR) repeat protein